MRRNMVVGAGSVVVLGAVGACVGVALKDSDRRVQLERQARVWRLSTRRSIAWGCLLYTSPSPRDS